VTDLSDELKVGDFVTHPSHGAGQILQVWNEKAVVALTDRGGVGTFAVGKLTLKLQAPLPDLPS
jgi:RNA polymerase-interacting CarD/CdnL/TRCF family regulator